MCSTVSATLEQVLGGVGGLDEEVVALVELRDRVDAALVERVGVFDATEQWKADGEYSFASWLRSRADISRSDAHQLARFARTLRTMPVTEAAVDTGKLSVTKARLLAGVINERTVTGSTPTRRSWSSRSKTSTWMPPRSSSATGSAWPTPTAPTRVTRPGTGRR